MAASVNFLFMSPRYSPNITQLLPRHPFLGCRGEPDLSPPFGDTIRLSPLVVTWFSRGAYGNFSLSLVSVLTMRSALRMLWRNRAFSAVAILSLAIGIGATTSVFSVVDRILFRSLPYRDGDRLMSLGVFAPMLNYEFMFGAAWLDFRQSQKVFESAGSWSGVSDCDFTAGQTVRLSCAASDAFF